jgi:hypothetical protein
MILTHIIDSLWSGHAEGEVRNCKSTLDKVDMLLEAVPCVYMYRRLGASDVAIGITLLPSPRPSTLAFRPEPDVS